MRKMITDPDNKYFRVLLNGEDISKRCYGADEEKGEAYCYEIDADGKFIVDHQTYNGRELAREILRGEVKLIDMRKSH